MADTVQLEGMTSYDAATHCASLMAAQRRAADARAAAAALQEQQQQQLYAQGSAQQGGQGYTQAQAPHMGLLQQQMHQEHLQHQQQHGHHAPSPAPASRPCPTPRLRLSATPHPCQHPQQPATGSFGAAWQQHHQHHGYVEAEATTTPGLRRCGQEASCTRATASPHEGLRRSARLQALQTQFA